MAIKLVSDTQLFSEGNVTDWLKAARYYCTEYNKTHTPVPFGAYLVRFVQFVSVAMVEHWNKEFLGGRKVSKLTDLINTAQQSGDEFDIYKALDYIADHNDYSSPENFCENLERNIPADIEASFQEYPFS